MAQVNAETSKMIPALCELSRRAGEAILKVYKTDFKVHNKADQSPVTQADLAAHRIITKGLKDLDPNTPLVSEESAIPPYAQRQKWKRFWIIDPLDGTKEFVKRNGEFTVNIALIENGQPVIGVVYAPPLDVLYYAEAFKGSWKKEAGRPPQRIFSDPANPKAPLVVATSRSHGGSEVERYLRQYQVKNRIYAGSSLKICLVAEGKADIYPRFGPTMEWDVAAGDCVYRNSSRQGQHASPLTYNKPDLRNQGFVLGF